MKIVYVFASLALKGGAERIVSDRMNYLADVEKYDISVITCKQFPQDNPNIYPLSNNVKQIDLKVADFKQYKYKYPLRLFIRWKYYQILQKKLQETISKISPDIVVGMSYAQADIVCKLNTKASIIIEAHEARQFTLSWLYNRNISWAFKTYYKLYRKKYLHTIEKRADVVISLTQGDAKDWHRAKHVEVIPNFSSLSVTRLSNGTTNHAIAIGRLCWQKGYDRLLAIWEQVSNYHPDWYLDIYGEGELESELKNRIQQKKLDNVLIHPFTNNISQKYAESSLCLLTSYFEGFSLVLLEALRHGVPCITFDCPYGPSDLVDNEKCGYVVKNGDIKQFAQKVCYLIEHPKTREIYSRAAIQKGASYNKDIIMKQWLSLFNSLKK